MKPGTLGGATDKKTSALCNIESGFLKAYRRILEIEELVALVQNFGIAGGGVGNADRFEFRQHIRSLRANGTAKQQAT